MLHTHELTEPGSCALLLAHVLVLLDFLHISCWQTSKKSLRVYPLQLWYNRTITKCYWSEIASVFVIFFSPRSPSFPFWISRLQAVGDAEEPVCAVYRRVCGARSRLAGGEPQHQGWYATCFIAGAFPSDILPTPKVGLVGTSWKFKSVQGRGGETQRTRTGAYFLPQKDSLRAVCVVLALQKKRAEPTTCQVPLFYRMVQERLVWFVGFYVEEHISLNHPWILIFWHRLRRAVQI